MTSIIFMVAGVICLILAFIKDIQKYKILAFAAILPCYFPILFFTTNRLSYSERYFFPLLLIVGWMLMKYYSRPQLVPNTYLFSKILYEKMPAHLPLLIIAAYENFYFALK